MQNFLEKIKKAKSLITFDRKDTMRAELMHVIDAHDMVRVRNTERHTFQRSSKIIWNRIFFNMPVIASIMLIALLGGGVSFAAEKSLPGDALYSVKVGVNEKVETALAFSPQAKAKVEQSLAERRVTEAETLAAEGRLNGETKDNLDGNFHAHAEAAASESEKIKISGNVSDAAGLDSDFESALGAHAAIIAQLEGNSSATAAAIHPLAVRVHAALGKAHQDRADAESELESGNTLNMQVAAQGKITAATNAIMEANNFIVIKTVQLGAQATANAQAELGTASITLADAQAKFTAGAYVGAFRLASIALRAAQESKALVQANVYFKLNLNNLNISLHGENQDELNTSSSDESEAAIKATGEASGTSQGEVNAEGHASSSENNASTSVQEHSDGGDLKSRINGWFHLNLGD